MASYLYLTATTNAASDNRNYCALAGISTANATDGGSGTAFGTSAGAFFGLGAVGIATNGATNLHNVTAAEFNTAMQTGSSVYAKSLIQISGRGDDAVQGSGVDAMVWAYKQGSSPPAWTNGILFDYPADANSFPFNSSSTVMKTGAGTIGTGIDFSGTTVSNDAFKSPGFNVTGTGALTALSGSFSSGVVTISNDSNGAIEIGGVNKAPFIDFHSYNGTPNDYDVRLQVTGGTGSSGNGTLTLSGSSFVLSGAVLQLGVAYVAGAPAATGYVTLKDSAGTTYKVLVGI